jgi:hypothetical protein
LIKQTVELAGLDYINQRMDQKELAIRLSDHEELIKLRRDIERVEMELYILKKAVDSVPRTNQENN